MKTKLMLLALLAAAPMASQAAMVEMADTELSAVEGQGFDFDFGVSPDFDVGVWNNSTSFGAYKDIGVYTYTDYEAWDKDPLSTKSVYAYSNHYVGSYKSFYRYK